MAMGMKDGSRLRKSIVAIHSAAQRRLELMNVGMIYNIEHTSTPSYLLLRRLSDLSN